MEYQKIVYSIISNILISTKVENIEVLENIENEPVLICPNHTSHYDGVIMHSISSRVSHTRTILMGEAFDEHSENTLYNRLYLKLLEDFDVKPMHRKKDEITKTFNDLKECYKYLKKDDKKFLIIYPDGEHIAPSRLYLDKNYINNLPLGAFKLSIQTNRKIIPVFIEPNKLFHTAHVIIGNPLEPNDYYMPKCLANAWYNEMQELYAKLLKETNSKVNQYTLKKKYRNKLGEITEDPNKKFI